MKPGRRDIGARDALWLAIAILELARARADHARRPLTELLAAPALAKRPPLRPPDAARLAWAIEAAAARVPWRSDCLIRALAARRWLARLGVCAELRLGVARAGESLAAHAWLTLDGRPLVGGDGAGLTPILGAGD